MIRGIRLKLMPQEIRGAPTWPRSRRRETRMGTMGTDYMSTRVAYSTPSANGNDDFENKRKSLIEKSKTGRQEEVSNKKRKEAEQRRKFFVVILASSSAVFMSTLGYMAYSPSFRTFQRTESPRMSQIADLILGMEEDDRSDSDTSPWIEDQIQNQRLRDLRRQRETAQSSSDVQ